MSGEADKISGTVKEKVGAATGNDRLESEGKAQHAEGKVEHALHTVQDKAAGVADAVKDRLHRDDHKQ